MKVRSESGDALPPILKSFLVWLVSLTALCLLVEFTCRLAHLGYPYDWPLMPLNPSFMDFRWYFHHFGTLHTAAFFVGPDIIMYPAPLVLFYWFFYAFQPAATPVFLAFIIGSTLTASLMLAHALTQRGLAMRSVAMLLASAYLLSYPLWFEFKQANMEIIVWVILSCGVYSISRRHLWIAALCFGVAGAMKFYPILYLGLLLAEKRYRECLVGCLTAAATLLFSIWLLGPSTLIAWHGMQAGLGFFRENFMLSVRPGEIGFDHSLFTLPKVIHAVLRRLGVGHPLSQDFLRNMLSSYLALAALTGSALYFRRIRHLPFVNQVLCIVTVCILLPPVSFDYTLLHLYVPWALLCFVAVRADRQGQFVPGLRRAFLCFAFLLAPLSELIGFHERFGGQVRSIVLVLLFIVGLRFPFSLETVEPKSTQPLVPERQASHLLAPAS